MLEKIIEAIETATGLETIPFYTTEIKDCVIYTCEPISDDGAKAAMRLNIRVITKTLENAIKYRQKIIAALVPIGDDTKINEIKSCVLNGGGLLQDEETATVHTLLYFDLIIRSENI